MNKLKVARDYLLAADERSIQAFVTSLLVLVAALGGVVPAGLGAAIIGVIVSVRALLGAPPAQRVLHRAANREFARKHPGLW